MMTDRGNSTSNVVHLTAGRRKRAERRRTIAFVNQMDVLAAHIPADVRLPVLVALIVAAEGSGDSRDIEAVNRLASKLMGDAKNLAKTVSRTAKPELRAVE
jgi:hypothetical protein